jgi:hypothetical protein
VPKQEKTPMSRLPVTSLEFVFGLPVSSLEVQSRVGSGLIFAGSGRAQASYFGLRLLWA